jgi:hypothetical protein
MKRRDTGDSAGPDGPLDELDLKNLGRIREAYAQADPMPADLPERIKFALALRNLECEVARLSEQEDQRALSSRGEEQSRTITFDSESLTIMIRVEANGDGTVRVDGWLAPAQRREIEMKTAASAMKAGTDEQGRFAFPRVPKGTAQLVVLAAASPAARSVVTPALIL